MNPKMQKAAKQLGADKKKLVILGALGAVGLFMGGKLFLSKAPDAAAAAPAGGTGTPAATAEATAITSPINRPVINVDLPATVSRDLFAVDGSLYVHIAGKGPENNGSVQTPPQLTEEEQRQRVIKDAREALKLQTTILGDNPRAVINGETLRVGETIKGYTLKKVLQRKAVVEINKIEVTLEM